MRKLEEYERGYLQKRRKLRDGRCLYLGKSIETIILTELFAKENSNKEKPHLEKA